MTPIFLERPLRRFTTNRSIDCGDAIDTAEWRAQPLSRFHALPLKPSLKILHHFRTRGSGAEGVHVAGIANAFAELGHRVVFSSPTGVDPRKTRGANPYAEAGKPGALARLTRRLPAFAFELLEIGYNAPAFFRNAALLQREQCDLIYERHAFFLFSTAFVARRFRVPLVVEVNELVGDPRVRRQPVFSAFARFCDRIVFRAASLIVAVSPHLQRRIAESGIDSKKILVLPNAVDRADFATPADGSGVRRRLGIGDATVIGFAGWFVPWHRLEMLLEVFAGLSAREKNLKLLLVGEGELRAALESVASRLGVRASVIFAGAVPHGEIPAHAAAMDICVVPHSNEYRSPIKLFEYMGQGRAVVAPRTEPIEMIVRDGVNGLLFQPGSNDDLAAQLANLAANPDLRERLGRQAREDVLENHTWTKNARRILDALGGNPGIAVSS
jgi:glycosyltransferase involved in cell wall biosynthesis